MVAWDILEVDVGVVVRERVYRTPCVVQCVCVCGVRVAGYSHEGGVGVRGSGLLEG